MAKCILGLVVQLNTLFVDITVEDPGQSVLHGISHGSSCDLNSEQPKHRAISGVLKSCYQSIIRVFQSSKQLLYNSCRSCTYSDSILALRSEILYCTVCMGGGARKIE